MQVISVTVHVLYSKISSCYTNLTPVNPPRFKEMAKLNAYLTMKYGGGQAILHLYINAM